MWNSLRCTIAVLVFATAGLAQDSLIVAADVKPQVRETAETIYVAACAAVEHEFGSTHQRNPKVILVLGAKKDAVDWEQGEIRLRKWDPYLFAQGVIALAYRQYVPLHVTLTVPSPGPGTAESTGGFRLPEK
jgi:hypothetical protein